MIQLIFLFVLFVFNQSALLANSVAQSVADRNVNKQGIAWDTQIPDRGREYALQAAQKDANTGAIMAGITGAALASAATGFFLAGDLATGSALSAMAALEFAQMAASNRDSNTNRQQKEVLLGHYELGDSALDLNEEKQKWKEELPQDFDRFLQKRGVDPDAFKNLIFDGKLTDQKSVTDALGLNEKSLSAGELELGAKRAEAELDNIFQSAQGRFDNQYASLMGNSSSQSNAQNANKSLDGSREGKNESQKREREVAKNSNSEEAFTVPPSLVSNYYGLADGAFTPQEMGLLTESYLRDQGILPKRKGINIFQLANQGYKNFSKTLNRAR